MNKFHVTLPALRKAGACVDGYNRLVRTLQGLEFTEDDAGRKNRLRFVHEDPISIRTILDSNSFDDALWALRCIGNADNDKDVRLFAIWCARQVAHLMMDERSTTALDVAERHAHGLATDDELAAARDAAWAAASAEASAGAGSVAGAVAWAVASAEAWAAAWAAASAEASAEAWAAQKNRLIEMLDTGKFAMDGAEA